jgi:hypothetical protein
MLWTLDPGHHPGPVRLGVELGPLETGAEPEGQEALSLVRAARTTLPGEKRPTVLPERPGVQVHRLPGPVLPDEEPVPEWLEPVGPVVPPR